MSLPDRLQRAVQALDAALDRLELAAVRRAEVEAARADGDEEFALLQDDRSRLAEDLDAALARVRALDRTADEVAGRLQQAGATVRAVLADLASTPDGASAGSHAEPG